MKIVQLIQELRKVYPKRSGGQGWGNLREKLPTLLNQGYTPEDIIEGTKRYARWCRASGIEGTSFVKQATTFYGPGLWFDEDYDLPTDGSVELTLDEQAAEYDLVRQDGEDDASLSRRLGVAMTRKRYG